MESTFKAKMGDTEMVALTIGYIFICIIIYFAYERGMSRPLWLFVPFFLAASVWMALRGRRGVECSLSDDGLHIGYLFFPADVPFIRILEIYLGTKELQGLNGSGKIDIMYYAHPSRVSHTWNTSVITLKVENKSKVVEMLRYWCPFDVFIEK